MSGKTLAKAQATKQSTSIPFLKNLTNPFQKVRHVKQRNWPPEKPLPLPHSIFATNPRKIHESKECPPRKLAKLSNSTIQKQSLS
jgi:hypothetical protein